MWLWWFGATVLASEPCERVGLSTVVGHDAPAVVVLGERKGHQPDLRRAERVVARLAKKGPVTLALEAIHRDHQGVLDAYAVGKVVPADLAGLVDWQDDWGFPWAPYEKLVTSAVIGVDVLAVGMHPTVRPPTSSIPIPPGYIHVLTDAMGEYPMPIEREGQFIQTVAYRDHSIASAAIQSWDRTGFLVILVDRLHVEGGLGVAWQAQRLTDAPVHAYVLAWAEAPCYPGDLVWR